MTPTQQERRIQAFYDDANVSRRNLCERVVHLEADMEELRKQLQAQRVENDKLRKLVYALLQCHVEDTDTCAKCEYRSPLHGGCMADVKADELGVEL